jgi:hypothetical protein
MRDSDSDFPAVPEGIIIPKLPKLDIDNPFNVPKTNIVMSQTQKRKNFRKFVRKM